MITGVAYKRVSDGKVWSLPKPNRHNHVIALMIEDPTEDIEYVGGAIQGGDPLYISGFVTESGQFMDRVAGAAYVIVRQQIKSLKWPPELYSEDLW